MAGLVPAISLGDAQRRDNPGDDKKNGIGFAR